MPELPEVESIRTQLEKYLVGHKIEKVEVRNDRIVEGDVKGLEGGKIEAARRFGKVVSVDLDNDFSFIAHVKLTGQLIYRGPNLKAPKDLSKKVTGGLGGNHTHVIFHLDKEGKLYYNDVRRFGWIRVVRTDDVEKTDFISKLGPEPFGKLDLKTFKEILASTRRAVKVVMMDQAKMGGVGNIYASDSLLLAKIHPATPANSLDDKQAKKLFDSLILVLERGKKYGGASELAFVTPDGSEGEYQKHTVAYGWQGKKCSQCKKGIIEKTMLGGRGTYICPVCQRSEK